jgi:hypothetical protein
MRKLILIAALALAACGGDEPANNAAAAEGMSAADIGPVNDATAIDAATGEAANMAADVNYTFNEEAMNAVANNAAGNNAL